LKNFFLTLCLALSESTKKKFDLSGISHIIEGVFRTFADPEKHPVSDIIYRHFLLATRREAVILTGEMPLLDQFFSPSNKLENNKIFKIFFYSETVLGYILISRIMQWCPDFTRTKRKKQHYTEHF